ncbi:hypothetical protein [Streptomyces sp. NPDC014734]|uniref:hypothetical protein n=1 Tax=Streptomyces sp. NPDC014734 TaxID=3364886 RepID=UPI0036FF25A6
MLWTSFDWGNVPTWISAIITSGSFMVATSVYRQNSKDKTREQAGKVTVSVPENVGRYDTVYARNDSELPVFRLRIVAADQRHGKNEKNIFTDIDCSIHRINPGETLTLKLPTIDVGDGRECVPAKKTICGIAFFDADGRHWMRMNDGFLLQRPDHRNSRHEKRHYRQDHYQANEELAWLTAPASVGQNPLVPLPGQRKIPGMRGGFRRYGQVSRPGMQRPTS